ncbi:hypothetical protein R4Z09_27810 [Niallia oryzisoli]|uniref:NADH dehydrogenase subunit 6 n=1 Tax=Niallia oryzisoli TaxID=1737571 RepID=A0ABZ2CEP8_9BACI
MQLEKLIGTIGSVGSLLYCGYFLFHNPYGHSSPELDVLVSFTMMFFLPMFIAIFASLSFKPITLIICSVWSMPLALYLGATPGVFKWLMIGPVLLLIAGILMHTKSRNRVK